MNRAFDEIVKDDFSTYSLDEMRMFEKKFSDIVKTITSKRMIGELMELYPDNLFIPMIKKITHDYEEDDGYITNAYNIDMCHQDSLISFDCYYTYFSRGGVYVESGMSYKLKQTKKRKIIKKNNFREFINLIFEYFFDDLCGFEFEQMSNNLDILGVA